jgi:hypothetical protein
MDQLPAHCVPLHTLLPQPCQAGIAPAPKVAFVLDKATRDRLLLLDTSLAPYLRRYLSSDDIERYTVCDEHRFLLALPAGWTRTLDAHAHPSDAWHTLAEHAPALARHLAIPATERPHHQYWWELDDHTALPARHQSIITWRIHRSQLWFARTTPGFVSAAAWFVSEGMWQAGLLNSSPMQRWLNRATIKSSRDLPAVVDALPVPQSLIADPELERLATHAAETHQARMSTTRAGVQSLVRAFAPLGAKVPASLYDWHTFDFARLQQALRRAFQGDIPERHHAEWHQWLTTGQAQHADLVAQAQRIDQRINALVAAHLPAPQE